MNHGTQTTRLWKATNTQEEPETENEKGTDGRNSLYALTALSLGSFLPVSHPDHIRILMSTANDVTRFKLTIHMHWPGDTYMCGR